jgi:hypothetical protein
MTNQSSHDLSRAEGMPVFTYDDESLGIVARVVSTQGSEPRRYLVVKGNLYATGEYYVPESEIQRVGQVRILLQTTRDDLAEFDWFKRPDGLLSQ